MSKYVVYDGMDGSGKGTQIDLLKQKLTSLALFTREPGGTPLAEEIRGLILAKETTPLNNFLLFWAAREELQRNLVGPTLRSGKHVFSDRGDSSTFAFQVCGEQHEELIDLFMRLRSLVFDPNSGQREPDLYIIFDLPAEVARERALGGANRAVNHLDARDLAYYKRVRDGFHQFVDCPGPEKVEFIDATRSVEEIHRNVLMVLAAKMVIPELAFFV